MFKLISNLFNNKEVAVKEGAVVKVERHPLTGGAIVIGNFKERTLCCGMNLKATDEEIQAEVIMIKNVLETGSELF